MIGLLFTAIWSAAAQAAAFKAAAPPPHSKPKNVILLIADGSGLAHITATKYLRGNDFQIGRMTRIALVTTHAADAAVTDSAAAATAFATGVKTNYEMLGVDPKGTPQTTVLELAEKKGRATGLVTTARFNDATVAAFAAHVLHRDQSAEIIIQLLESGAELVVGGGAEILGKADVPTLEVLRRESKYTIVDQPAELWNVPRSARVMGIFTTNLREGEWPDAPLEKLAKWAIDRLKDDPEGFFLVIESEATDGTSHRNFDPELRAALAGFDAAVGVALDFAAARGDTLVIVTSDHETGGMRISDTRARRRWRMEFSTTDHTGTMIPLFAFGPGSEAFVGIMDNTDVGKKLLALQR